MSKNSLSRLLAAVILESLVFLGTSALLSNDVSAEQGVQVLTRGPVHEAFAANALGGGVAGEVIARSPYEPIQEIPPDQRPMGDDVSWIPGYWSWDDDRDDFFWISGVWRDIPPGRQWVPGYWSGAGNGSRWISGFWGDAFETDVTYLPPPPEMLQEVPRGPAPSPDTLWASGYWVWVGTRYDWQPGSWVARRPDWVWSPAHYAWTPRGHVYVPGYWDHEIGNRGVLFAPVYYDQPVYRQPNYFYSPATVIDLAVVVGYLFLQSRSNHYYFGDYYDSGYERRGYYPWHSMGHGHQGYDSLYSQFRATQLRRDRDWDFHVDEQYRYRRDNPGARPPHTLDLQINVINSRGGDETPNVVIGRSLTETIRGTTGGQRFLPVNAEERDQNAARGRGVRYLQVERARLESRSDRPQRADGEPSVVEPERIPLPPSPVTSRAGGRLEGTRELPDVEDTRRSSPVVRTEPTPAQNRDVVRERPSPAPVSTGRPAPRLSGQPAIRAPRPDSVPAEPHPVEKRLGLTERPTVSTVPRTRAPLPQSNPALRGTGRLPRVQQEKAMPPVRQQPVRTEETVSDRPRGPKADATPVRASRTTPASKGELKREPSKREPDRTRSGPGTGRGKTKRPASQAPRQ